MRHHFPVVAVLGFFFLVAKNWLASFGFSEIFETNERRC
jgi:hypothetical protein